MFAAPTRTWRPTAWVSIVTRPKSSNPWSNRSRRLYPAPGTAQARPALHGDAAAHAAGHRLLTLEDVVDYYKQFYAGRTFVRVLDAGQQPKTASVVGTNAARSASRSTSARACWWRRAPSTICARALRAKQSSAPISSLVLTSDEACPQWRARCSTFDC
ncbi:MAG: hypothetical protein ACLU0O_04975 [Collinsella sp.]